MHALLAEVGWQSDWWQVLGQPFMRNALAAGAVVAVAAGLLGYFVVVRQGEFAAHALGHIGFPGATGAALVGLPPLLGLTVFCVLGAVVIGALGNRAAERATATGTVLAMSTALGVLFASLATRTTSTVTNVLFGNLLAVGTGQLVVFVAFTAALALVLLVVGRPLAMASVTPDVAEARGVPVRALGVVFLVLMGLLVAMAVQVVGTLLLFALVVTPPATALRLTARPWLVGVLGGAVGLVAVGGGLTLATMFNLPPSFFVVATSTLVWLVVLAATSGRRRGTAAHRGHDHRSHDQHHC